MIGINAEGEIRHCGLKDLESNTPIEPSKKLA